MSGHRARTTSFAETNKSHPPNFGGVKISREYRLTHVITKLIFKVFGGRILPVLPVLRNCSEMIWGRYDFAFRILGDKDGSKVTTVVATTGSLPDRTQEISYTDTKVIGNGSFGVVYQARMCESSELVAIKKVLQDKRFKVNIVLNAFIFTAGNICARISYSFVFIMPKFIS